MIILDRKIPYVYLGVCLAGMRVHLMPETQTTHFCMEEKQLKGVSSLYKHTPYLCDPYTY